MNRRLSAIAIVMGVAALLPVSTAVGASGRVAVTAHAFDAHDEVLNILPPGSNGNVDAAQAAQVGPSRTASRTNPPHFADQLEMYDALNKLLPSKITESVLLKDYKDARLGGEPNHMVSTESPEHGVVIKRDNFGVPHITGQTAEEVAYGAGYAGTEDRMFLTDILRHTGAADMAAFLGPTPSDIAMDQSQLLIAPYTPAEAQAQLNKAVKRYPTEGAALLKRLDAFIAGINAAQRALCPGAFGLPVPGGNGAGFGPKCPAEYAALQKKPTDYTRADIVAIASLVGGIFGKGGGQEYQNALWYEALRARFGQRRAIKVYNDLRQKNDPEAATTATKSFPYMDGGLAPTKRGVALPVPDAATAPGTAAPASGNQIRFSAPPVPGTAAYRRWQANIGNLHNRLGHLNLGFSHHDESNALLVDRQHSTDGHPVVVFGPQTGYYTPQLLTEVDLHGPGIDARGVSFAGTQFVVELGHGVDYAWSATSADADLVDTVFERLCNPDGSKPTIHSTHYLAHGKCVAMNIYTHDEGAVLPTAGGTGPPKHLAFTVMRTRHGVVQFRTLATTAKGKKRIPVAVVTQRSTYGHEVDSAIGFARINNPNYVHNATDFEHAFQGVDYTFNWFYADDKDIAYKVSGLLPVRPKTVEPDLPRWGDSRYDWRGYLSAKRHPHQIDPPRGYFVSWNNKQAPKWSTADDQWGHSYVHRSRLLSSGVERLISGGRRINRAQLDGVMMNAATTDLRARYLLPLAIKVLGNDRRPQAKQAIRLFKTWLAHGSHRVDRRRTGHYTDQAAIALFDTWWDNNGAGNRSGLAKDTIRPLLHSLVDKNPAATDDHPRKHLGSSWDTVAFYGYVWKTLRAVLGYHVPGAYSQHYCGSLTRCRKALRASLQVAIKRALSAEKVSSVTKLTYDKTKDDIVSVTAGLVGVRAIDWQNRPTFQQVVNYRHHRAGAGFTGRFGPGA